MNNIEVERSIIKKYRKEIWARFVKAVKEYKLVNENDSIASTNHNKVDHHWTFYEARSS